MAAASSGNQNAAVDNGRGEAHVAHEEAAGEVENEAGTASNFLADEITLVNASASPVDDARAPLVQRRVAITNDIRDAFRRVAETEEDEARGGALVVSPASTDEAAEVLLVASREGVPVVPEGAGTWLGDDQTHARGCVFVSTRRLSRIVAHSPADLVVTVEAGVPLSALNEELARAGQWLPLDPPGGAGTSVGGVVATNTAGAHGSAYGTPRAFVLGMTVVLADGRVVRVGGRVVKNVAGYDLSKLFTGSFGTLGLITEINFKLRPRPEREATLRANAETVDNLFVAARGILRGEFLPVALDVRASGAASRQANADPAPRFTLLARFAGSARTVESQLGRARGLLGEGESLSGVEVVEDDARLWAEGGESNSDEAQHIELKVNVLPTRLRAALLRLEELLGASAALDNWGANVAAGRLRVRLYEVNDPAGCVDALTRLRAGLRAEGGSVVVENATRDLRDVMDRIGFDQWGMSDERAALMRRVKLRLDPRGLLPRRFFV
ncbi:MAG: FAD-binding oxidoreductase [Acidobacteria bacterium]|nr:FAD-binding oxidoreductase [Acidobacteriota bacterium]